MGKKNKGRRVRQQRTESSMQQDDEEETGDLKQCEAEKIWAQGSIFDEADETEFVSPATTPHSMDTISNSSPVKSVLGPSSDRRSRRRAKFKPAGQSGSEEKTGASAEADERKALSFLAQNEDELLSFVANVNRVYQDSLSKPPPFMTFILIGMQSSGKSTLVERFLGHCINVVKEGTGTRCPLDITCIHDDRVAEPVCELYGKEMEAAMVGKNMCVNQVFTAVTKHNQKLSDAGQFSCHSLNLVYRSKKVQNMRFVDLPGIISNKSKGSDNREAIKVILKAEMNKPNTKLCVLMEPKEFATNAIVDFIDEAVGGREHWVRDASFLMTKFDTRLGDSRTGSKSNAWFQEYKENEMVPFLIITPSLETEKLGERELYNERQRLLTRADGEEKQQFGAWLAGHRSYLQSHSNDEELHAEYKAKIGFPSAQQHLRGIMLEDTIKRLPEVLQGIRTELQSCEKEQKALLQVEQLNDPDELRELVGSIVDNIKNRICEYLDGSIDVAMNFPNHLQNLEDEITEEEESDWAERELNHHTEKEEGWRNRILDMDEIPEQIQPGRPFIGGKQYQRAFAFFNATMIDNLPEPQKLKEHVSNTTGYLGGGLQRENWERAMVKITEHCLKEITHPGINYFIKHVGAIFRRLLPLALEDLKQGEACSSTLRMLPKRVEHFIISHFDDSLWNLLVKVADKTHSALEPMYTSVDPNLPTFISRIADDNDDDGQLYILDEDEEYVKAKSAKTKQEESYYQAAKDKMYALLSGSGTEAKKFLRNESKQRAQEQKSFLSDRRTAMIVDKEANLIVQRSFEYIAALMEFNMVTLKFQFNHYLFIGFKDLLSVGLGSRLLAETNWNELVDRDDGAKARLAVLKEQIEGLRESLKEVSRMQSQMR